MILSVIRRRPVWWLIVVIACSLCQLKSVAISSTDTSETEIAQMIVNEPKILATGTIDGHERLTDWICRRENFELMEILLKNSAAAKIKPAATCLVRFFQIQPGGLLAVRASGPSFGNFAKIVAASAKSEEFLKKILIEYQGSKILSRTDLAELLDSSVSYGFIPSVRYLLQDIQQDFSDTEYLDFAFMHCVEYKHPQICDLLQRRYRIPQRYYEHVANVIFAKSIHDEFLNRYKSEMIPLSQKAAARVYDLCCDTERVATSKIIKILSRDIGFAQYLESNKSFQEKYRIWRGRATP